MIPGHFLVSARRSRRRPSVSGTSRVERPSPGAESPGGSHERVRSLLEDSVSRHLVSDVPLGVFLSGGVDSGGDRRLRAPRERLGGAAVDDADGDLRRGGIQRSGSRRESWPIASIPIIARFASPAVSSPVSCRSSSPRWTSPPTMASTPTSSRRPRGEAGLTVVLSGLGGDEVFWGYKHHRSLDGNAVWLAPCPALARQALAGAPPRGVRCGPGQLDADAHFSAPASSAELYLVMRGFFPPQHVMRLLGIGQHEMNADRRAPLRRTRGRRQAGGRQCDRIQLPRGQTVPARSAPSRHRSVRHGAFD